MKRPSLKAPEPKAPAFLTDLFYDLRDRRLLLPIALVLVAIAATPILLGQGSEPKLPAAAEGAIAALKEESRQETSTLTVVEAKPGLRDYRKRLRDRTPTDPFKQRYTAPVLKGAELNEPKDESGGGSGGGSGEEQGSTGSTGGEADSGSSKAATGGAPSGESGSAGGNGGGGNGGDKKHAVLFSFAVNLQIVHTTGNEADGNKKTSEPEVRKEILPTTVLPGKKKQVVTYMGLSPKTRKPLFLVSTDVSGVFGEGKCVAGTDNCQLIELEPGFPETFEYGEDNERYKFKVTDVKLVIKGKV
ncbi:MAG TPA: hypothetical protein VJ989_00785 [Solirubrobacterales bacterium]|nr:hypothetical protein [Solirubrobacterales bacterium]